MAHSFTLPSSYTDAAAPQAAGAMSTLNALASRLRALLPSRQSEIETYIMAHGGALTDELERDISRRFGRQAGI